MSDQRRSTRSRRLIFTLYGDYLRQRTDEVWVGSLIRLLEPLGMTDQAVRSTLSRMLRRGWFVTRRRGRHSYYSLTAKSRRLLAEGEQRLFAPRRPRPWDGRWHLLDYSVPERRRHLRDRLRQRLVWLGFGSLGSGSWISPYSVPEEVRSWLAQTGAARYVHVFAAECVCGDSSDLVARAWNLKGLEREYRAFLEAHQRQYEAALRDGAGGALAPADAFARRFALTQEFLDFPYLDPGLPEELLPAGWPGEDVRRLFQEYHTLLAPQAGHFVDEVLSSAPGPARSRSEEHHEPA